MVAYLANLQYLHIEKPQGYSTDAAQKIAEETSVSSGGEENHIDKTDMEDQPNILVIMNEAFSDILPYMDISERKEAFELIRHHFYTMKDATFKIDIVDTLICRFIGDEYVESQLNFIEEQYDYLGKYPSIFDREYMLNLFAND